MMKPLAWITMVLSGVVTAGAVERPNVVLIYADDMGYGEIEALNPERGRIPTPHLNKVARNSRSTISPSRQRLRPCAASQRSIAHGKVTPSSNTPTCTSHSASRSMTASSLQ